jgi:hypothetical protein
MQLDMVTQLQDIPTHAASFCAAQMFCIPVYKLGSTYLLLLLL